MTTLPLLELKNISKSFPGVRALSNVDFVLYPNEIVGLCGENGAGKSTLIKILGGVHQPDSGTLQVGGKKTVIKDTHSGIALGISIIYQELSLVPELSVAENIYLGNLPHKAGAIDFKTLYADTDRILKLLGLDVNPKAKVGTLGISLQQLVEIGKALARNAKILIMDEPTSSLGSEDAEKLFKTMRSLKTKGYGIIFISHRLEELFGVCDKITVLRDGEVVASEATGDWSMESLVFAMVNRKIEQLYPKRKIAYGKELMSAQGLENDLISGVSFSLKAGEILGVAGLMGSGRTELLKTLYGVNQLKNGVIAIEGEPRTIKSPQYALEYGIAFVPEDRKAEALILDNSVKENVILSVLKKISRFRIISKNVINKISDYAIKYFDIKTPSRNQKVMNLSGGNQQKIVFARIAEREPKKLLLDEPTRGVDIGSKVEIYNKIMDFAESGTAIILVSSDLTEIIGLTDRVLVMSEGKMITELVTAETNSQQIMDYATGEK